MMKSRTNIFIFGVMCGTLLAGAYFLGIGYTVPGRTLSPLTVTSTVPLVESSGSVSVTDQSSGTAVVIESVTVPPPGVWIAVRETDGNTLANVLGAARVDGPKAGVTVPLLRATEPSRSYAIQLYRNDGSGAFDPAVNSVYVDFDTGAPVIAYFTTTP